MILKINKFQAFTRKLDQRNENKYSATAAIYRQGIEKKISENLLENTSYSFSFKTNKAYNIQIVSQIAFALKNFITTDNLKNTGKIE